MYSLATKYPVKFSFSSIQEHNVKNTAHNISLARLRVNFVFEIIVFKFKVNFVFACSVLNRPQPRQADGRYASVYPKIVFKEFWVNFILPKFAKYSIFLFREI